MVLCVCHGCPWIIFPRCSSSLTNANTLGSVNILGAACSICGATPSRCIASAAPQWDPAQPWPPGTGLPKATCLCLPVEHLHPKSHLRSEIALRNAPLEQRTKQNHAVSFFYQQGHGAIEWVVSVRMFLWWRYICGVSPSHTSPFLFPTPLHILR